MPKTGAGVQSSKVRLMALLNPKERIQLAQHLRQRANSEKLPVRKKQDLRRKASNLVKLNSLEAASARSSLPSGQVR